MFFELFVIVAEIVFRRRPRAARILPFRFVRQTIKLTGQQAEPFRVLLGRKLSHAGGGLIGFFAGLVSDVRFIKGRRSRHRIDLVLGGDFSQPRFCHLLKRGVHCHVGLVLLPINFVLPHPKRLHVDFYLRRYVARRVVGGGSHFKSAPGNGYHFDFDFRPRNRHRIGHHEFSIDFNRRALGRFLVDNA